MVKSSSSGSGSGRYPSGRSSGDLSCRYSSLPCPVPASPSFFEAVEADLTSLVSKSSVRYVETVLKKVKKKTEPGQDELGNTPSDLTDFGAWRDYQGDNSAEAKFLCYRPAFASPPLPLALVSEDIAKFKQDASQGVPEAVDMDFAEEFWNRVQDDKYVTDHEEDVKSILRTLVGGYLGHDVIPYYVLQGRVQADGILSLNQLIRLAFEFKSQAGNAGDPDFQVLDCFLRATVLNKGTRADGWRQHALAICLLGPRLEVWGATVEGAKVWAEPLAETKCYGPEDYLVATARIWRAVRLFVDGYKAVPLVSPPVPWPLGSEKSVQQLEQGKLVFSYANSEGEREVAKFVTRYSVEAHKAWLPYAPEIYDVVEKSGVKMIRMEYLSRDKGWEAGAKVVNKFKDDTAHIAKLKGCIEVAIRTGHSRGVVHGDMRLCNILLRQQSQEAEADGYPAYDVKILDFDWAGRLGDVAYPRLSKRIAWPPGARYGVAITKEHDIYFKDHLVEQLQ